MTDTTVLETPHPPVTQQAKKRNVLLRIISGIGAVFRFIRITIANLLVLALIVLLFMFLSMDTEVRVEPGSILVFAPGVMVEQSSKPGFWTNLLIGDYLSAGTHVHQAADAISRAAADTRIIALEIDPSGLGADLAQLDIIGDALKEFSASGKPIYAFANNYSQGPYLLSTYADKVYMDPLGEIVFSGVGFESMYYQGLIEKLSVNVHTYRAGEYKSAIEPYVRDSMSEVVKESYRPIVDSLWQGRLDRIAENRNLELDEVTKFTENLASLTGSGSSIAQLTKEHGFVDELISRDELLDQLAHDFNLKPRRNQEDFDYLYTESYYHSLGPDIGSVLQSNASESDYRASGNIAIVTVEGTIMDSVGDFDVPLSEEAGVVDSLTNALLDEVDAVVLRINSPGGSVIASEEIRRKLVQIRDAGIPVVASMSGVAASGGYWIAAEADQIFAAESTITGSIGVFAFLPSFENTLERAGVTTDGVYSHEGQFRLSATAGVTEQEAAVMQASVNDSYREFINLVSAGRDMTPENVESIAGGRIWTGSQAIENGLVDQLGYLDDAIQYAANLAELGSFRVYRYGGSTPTLMSGLLGKISALAPPLAPELADYISETQKIREQLSHHLMLKPRTVYALCEACETQ